jgi:hypothetical protein
MARIPGSDAQNGPNIDCLAMHEVFMEVGGYGHGHYLWTTPYMKLTEFIENFPSGFVLNMGKIRFSISLIHG